MGNLPSPNEQVLIGFVQLDLLSSRDQLDGLNRMIAVLFQNTKVLAKWFDFVGPYILPVLVKVFIVSTDVVQSNRLPTQMSNDSPI